MKRFLALILFASLLGSYSCSSSDKYRVFVYPNRNDLTNHIEAGEFDSVDAARDVAKEQMRRYPNCDYEIGKNCEKRSGSSLWICEETFR